MPSLRSLLLRLAALLCAALLFAAAVWWDNAANRGIDPPPAAPIPFADVPQGGVNTYNLHAEADPAKVARTFEMIAAAGLHWVRVQFPWEDIEVCGKGQFTDCRGSSAGADTWAKYDYIVEEATTNGLELLVRLDTPPDWARQQAISSPELQAAKAAGRYPLTGPPDNYDDYGDFVAAVADRYRGRVRFFQIWNEPNLPGEWNYRDQSPADFVRLLGIARERITAANPDAVIVFPALSPTDGRGDGVSDLDYLQGVYDAGGKPLFDIMSSQLYGLGQPPSEHRYIRPGSSLMHPIDTKADVGRVVLQREIMVRNGDANKAIWVSELGWNSAPDSVPEPARSTWGQPVSEEAKGEYLVATMQRAQREWPWMGAMCIWMFRFGGEPPDPQNPTPYFQLVSWDFTPLPAYDRVRAFLTDPANQQIAPAQRNPFATAATIVSGALLIGATAWAFIALVAVPGALLVRLRGARNRRGRRLIADDRLIGGLLIGALLIFYLGSPQLPITALGAALFGVLALLRPDLALLLVPLTVPLYLAPKGVWDQRFGLSRPEGYFIPLHEFVLLCAVAGTTLHALLMLVEPPGRRDATDQGRQRSSLVGRRWSMIRRPSVAWPVALWALAGTIGVAVADARGVALREWRWLIVEPLLFYALVRWWSRDNRFTRRIVGAWLVAGVGSALIGLLQIVGVDLAALLPQSNCFSDRVVLAEGGLRRISSVYCHPNNLALALGRVWPVLFALAIGAGSRLADRQPPTTHDRPSSVASGPSSIVRRLWSVIRHPWLLAGAAIVLLALGLTLSKGALIGAFVALVMIGLVLWRTRHRLALPLLGVAALGVATVLGAGLLLGVERLNPFGGSSGARLELWTSALTMLRDHPLTGVGLDQFYHYRTDPAFGDRYIDPAARATNEQFASHPHNVVLDLLTRTGPLGLLAMIWLVAWIARRCWRSIGRGDDRAWLHLGLLAALAAALAHGLVDNFYFVPDLAFVLWLWVAVVQAADRVTGAPRR